MAVAGRLQGGGNLPSGIRRLPPSSTIITRSYHKRPLRPPPPPIYISTNPAHVNPGHLQDLYRRCNHSCHRFPRLDSDGCVEPVDLLKLRVALSHSSVVVSVFSKPDVVASYSSFSNAPDSSLQLPAPMSVGGNWLQRVAPITPENGELVGFGRAVSDCGLTASIYDVVVLPAMRGMGIGRMIVQRIIRVMTSRGIYDIAALCSEEERLLFEACGFGSDILGSTTMMYARTASGQGNEVVKRIGRRLLEKGKKVCPMPPLLIDNLGIRQLWIFLNMGKIWVEVCLISARGLRRTSTLFKLQWYAIGWIDPNNKYCSRIDASGNANPVWKTKFSALVDNSEASLQDLAVHVEVYSREPIFLRERLQGTATIVLKEFLCKYMKNSEVPQPVQEVGSFQLRKRNSGKPQGFVDVSIRVSEEKEEPSSYAGNEEGFRLRERDHHNYEITLSIEPSQAHPPRFAPAPFRLPENHPPSNSAYPHPVPPPAGPSSSGGRLVPIYTSASGPGYQPPRTPPPPPPPSNVGYIPTFLPRTDHPPPSYINMPAAGVAPGRPGGGGFGMGVGAGALAAGAVIFGDDFMSGFDVPAGLQDPSLTLVTDPPF